MFKNSVAVLLAVGSAAVLSASSGCSSSAAPAATGDSGTPADDGGGGTTDDSGSGGSGGGTTDNDGGGAPAGYSCTNPGVDDAYSAPSVKDVAPAKDKCTKTQVDAFNKACFGTGGTAADCSAFLQDKANAACFQCAFTPVNNASWGFYVVDTKVAGLKSGGEWFNYGGLAKALAGVSDGCANALNDLEACTSLACAACKTDADFKSCRAKEQSTGVGGALCVKADKELGGADGGTSACTMAEIEKAKRIPADPAVLIGWLCAGDAQPPLDPPDGGSPGGPVGGDK